MRNRPVNVLIYLVSVTCLIFYGPKIVSVISGAGGSKAKTPSSLAAKAKIDLNAYYSLREVAAVQLGHIVITYSTDEATGRIKPRFQNAACPVPQSDAELLKKFQKDQQEDLHKRILLLRSCADSDNSGYVDEGEGARFRDLYEFGHLVANGFDGESIGLAALAGATGKTEETVAENLDRYQDLIKGCQPETRNFFPGLQSAHH